MTKMVTWAIFAHQYSTTGNTALAVSGHPTVPWRHQQVVLKKKGPKDYNKIIIYLLSTGPSLSGSRHPVPDTIKLKLY